MTYFGVYNAFLTLVFMYKIKEGQTFIFLNVINTTACNQQTIQLIVL